MPEDKVEKDNSPNSSLIVPILRITEQMEFLAKNHQVVSIDRLVEHLEGDSNRFVVAVTFDDGYKDHFTYVLPELVKRNISATFFPP